MYKTQPEDGHVIRYRKCPKCKKNHVSQEVWVEKQNSLDNLKFRHQQEEDAVTMFDPPKRRGTGGGPAVPDVPPMHDGWD